MYDHNNIFKKIINKSASAQIIYEDDNIIAFNDINPVAPIHIIVIPKKEYMDYGDFINKASEVEIKDYFSKLLHIIGLVGLKDKGYRLVTNKGEKSGQSVFHFHYHIIGGGNLSNLVD